MLIPFAQHHRFLQITRYQLDSTKPLRKNLWQKILSAKIRNQIQLLRALELETGRKTEEGLIAKITGLDETNVEAEAARYYWPRLFSREFKRVADDEVNKALNYGYSILRSAIARAVVGRGLLPQLGVRHDNQLNQFNLVDDLIEPYRPFVDEKVRALFVSKEQEFDRPVRGELLAVLNRLVSIGEETMQLVNAIRNTADSYVTALKEKRANRILLPVWSQEPTDET
jgi:CRISPR-associated protein Cas1